MLAPRPKSVKELGGISVCCKDGKGIVLKVGMVKTIQGVQSRVLLVQPQSVANGECWCRASKVGVATVTLAKEHMIFWLRVSGKERRDIWDSLDVVQWVRNGPRVSPGI